MDQAHKEELAFTLMMVVGMVLIMLTYNSVLAVGFTGEAASMVMSHIVPTILVAGILELFVVSHNVHKIHKLIVSPGDPQFKHIIVLALLFVTFMAAIMSLYGTLLSTGTENSFWYHYGINLLRNWPVALIAQLVVMGPLVRVVHMRLFKHTALVA